VTSASENTRVVVDCHAHLAPKQLLTELHAGEIRFPNIEVTAHESTFRVSFNGGAPTRPVAPRLTDPARRSAWLAENRIDLQIVGGWLDIFGYDLPEEEGAEWAEVLTTALNDSVADDPRQVVLGTLPMQDPVRAAEALRAQRAGGSPGVMIATRAAGRDLDDPLFAPFWEAADETGAVVFLHPGFGGASDRYHDFGLVNGLARLEDTTVTLARLLYAGIPARHPGAKVLVAHAGAALPFVLGRLVRNHLMNPDTTSDPLESFAHLYFDSVVFDPQALSFLVDKVGPERILLGSDYPFPIGDLAPRNVVAEAKLDDAQRALIESGNARRLFLGEPA
jgi:aminocarboxymuconate-semialdehyde decarboxylase